MTDASPRVDPRLVLAAFELDDRNEAIAETWRRVGAVASGLGLPRPGYDTVRLLVGPHRARQAEIRKLLEPAVGGVLTGRITQGDIDRVWEAATIAERDRRARRK